MSTTPDSPPGPPLVRLHEVSRSYGKVRALTGVSLTVAPGQIVGLLGPNGAGKSTLINLVLGLRRPDAGTVEIFGGPPGDPRFRRELGCTPQETSLPETLKVAEAVALVAGHYPDPVPADELFARFGLEEHAGRQCGALSGGQKRRVALALAVVGRPRLVVLDEPTTGLDVGARHDLWSILRELVDGGTTVLVSSHYLEEIETFADRIVVLHEGRIVADDSLEAVRRRVGVQLLQFTGPADVAALPGVVRHEQVDGRHELAVRDSDAVVNALVAQQIPFESLRIRGASLEEALAALTDLRESA